MNLVFKSKQSSSVSNYDNVNKLYDFLLDNKKYLRLVLDMMSKNKKNLSSRQRVQKIIERNMKCNNEIKGDIKYNEFIDLMERFYNVESKRLLNDQRGALLEKLWYNNGPFYYRQHYYEVTKESQVFCDGDFFKGYKNDIDVVYKIANEDFDKTTLESNINEYLKLIELDECKSSAENASESPMDLGNKNKFKLMQNVKKQLLDEKLSCRAHIITYDGDATQTKHWLSIEGINEIEVLCREKIEKVILKNY